VLQQFYSFRIIRISSAWTNLLLDNQSEHRVQGARMGCAGVLGTSQCELGCYSSHSSEFSGSERRRRSSRISWLHSMSMLRIYNRQGASEG